MFTYLFTCLSTRPTDSALLQWIAMFQRKSLRTTAHTSSTCAIVVVTWKCIEEASPVLCTVQLCAHRDCSAIARRLQWKICARHRRSRETVFIRPLRHAIVVFRDCCALPYTCALHRYLSTLLFAASGHHFAEHLQYLRFRASPPLTARDSTKNLQHVCRVSRSCAMARIRGGAARHW
jgi:hypothetical protein